MSVIGFGLLVFLGEAQAQTTAPKKDPAAAYTFFEFSSQMKNMNIHGLILDQKTGKAWVLITVGANAGFAARPVKFEDYDPLDVNPETGDVVRFPIYTPSEADGVRQQLNQSVLAAVKGLKVKKSDGEGK
jgi:hypothetical protein